MENSSSENTNTNEEVQISGATFETTTQENTFTYDHSLNSEWDTNTELLVIVNHYDADISWAKELKLPHIFYEKEKPEAEPYSAVNKGKSETNLLKFIFDFYDRLPRNVAIIHQYEYKFYHEGSILEMLNDPDLLVKYYNSPTPGHLSLNSFILGHVYPQIRHYLVSGWWTECMAKYFGNIQDYDNFTLGKKGCAQFIISRERILSLPREFYTNMYNWYITRTLDEEMPKFDPVTKCRMPLPTDGHSNGSYIVSRLLEWTWQLLFTAVRSNSQSCGIIINGIKIYAKYGTSGYYTDVTIQLIKHCLFEQGLFIPKQMDFNTHFGDTVCGVEKILAITVIIDGNKTQHFVKESREHHYTIPFNYYHY